jgi:hypothetical protein
VLHKVFLVFLVFFLSSLTVVHREEVQAFFFSARIRSLQADQRLLQPHPRLLALLSDRRRLRSPPDAVSADASGSNVIFVVQHKPPIVISVNVMNCLL